MIKERVPISGDLQSKVKQLMEYAGWYEGRSVDREKVMSFRFCRRPDLNRHEVTPVRF